MVHHHHVVIEVEVKLLVRSLHDGRHIQLILLALHLVLEVSHQLLPYPLHGFLALPAHVASQVQKHSHVAHRSRHHAALL